VLAPLHQSLEAKVARLGGPPADPGDPIAIAGRIRLLYQVDQELNFFPPPEGWALRAQATEQEVQVLDDRVNQAKEDLYRQASEEVADLIDAIGWFTISAYGEEIDVMAWVLVQHADHDLPLQKRVLALLEPLVIAGETRPANQALLVDRIAVAEGRDQVYGTQRVEDDTCPPWTPWPIEAPETVDERRSEFGLAPLAEYVAHMEGMCRGIGVPTP
jgi:hypothetical protein